MSWIVLPLYQEHNNNVIWLISNIWILFCARVSDPNCLTANSSAEWLMKTFGYFSRFAFITDFYKLNPNFTGVRTCSKYFVSWSAARVKPWSKLWILSPVLWSAGGSSPPRSKTNSRDAGGAAQGSSGQRCRHQQSVWLPDGVSWTVCRGLTPAASARHDGKLLSNTSHHPAH